MRLVKKIIGIFLTSTFISVMFLGMASFASMPVGVMPRATGQDDGTYSRLEASCGTDSISIKYTNKSGKKCYCEVIGYLKDQQGNDIAENESLFSAGTINSGKSVSDAQQRSDVFSIVASGNIYDGPGATYKRLEHRSLVIGR